MNNEDKIIAKTINDANDEIMKDEKNELYFDFSIWKRDVNNEVLEPIEGLTSGKIPSWISGILLRNGPGKTKIGSSSFQHLFDGSALIHRFHIDNGKATYQCRFLPTKTYKANQAAQRIVFSEFGTQAAPDPCQTIFQKFSSIFQTPEPTDNTLVSIYPLADELYAFSECPKIHRIDPVTLDSLRSENIFKKVNIVHHSSHPQVMQDGTVFNVGLCVESKPKYSVIVFPKTKNGEKKEGEDVFDDAKIVATVPSRWSFHPGYMHSFGITDNYYIIIEQPFCLSVPSMWTIKLTKKPAINMLKWYDNESTLIHVVSRETGELVRSFHCEAFFYFHTINQYEEENHIVFDVCAYKDAAVIEAMYLEELGMAKENNNFGKKTRTRPVRFVLPLEGEGDENLVKLPGTEAKAWSTNSGEFWAKAEILSDISVELPRINYPKYNGKKYRYFYGFNIGTDEKLCGSVVKVDTVEKSKIVWQEESSYAGEPVFVASPGAIDEDDGVLLVSVLTSGKSTVTLVVLDAKSFKELGRTVFETPDPISFSFHGWFCNSDTLQATTTN